MLSLSACTYSYNLCLDETILTEDIATRERHSQVDWFGGYKSNAGTILTVLLLLCIGVGTMGAMGAAAPIRFVLWRHLICPHTAMHVTPTLWNLPCPHEEKHLPTPMLCTSTTSQEWCLPMLHWACQSDWTVSDCKSLASAFISDLCGSEGWCTHGTSCSCAVIWWKEVILQCSSFGYQSTHPKLI